MRKLRILVIAVFILSLACVAGYTVMERMTADHTPPVLTSGSDSISVSVSASEEELTQGLSASDDKDGDLTQDIRVSSMSHFTERGKRTVTYVVFDSANQAATLTRELIYTDYVPLRIQLNAPLRLDINDMTSGNLEEIMQAQDCLDGDISNQIRVSMGDTAYSSELTGEYGIVAQVSNSAGDVCSVPLTVTVVDASSQEERGKYYPTLSQYIVYTPVGQERNPSDYLIGLEHNGEAYQFGSQAEADLDALGEEIQNLPSASDVTVSGTVDYNTPGTYQVAYSYTSADGVTAVTNLAVVVEEQ